MGLIERFFKAKESDATVAAPPLEVRVPEVSAKPEKQPKKVKKPRVVKKTAKELATSKGEPWVNIVSVELDSEDIGQGAFELDWNEFFVVKLIKSGYKGKDDQQIVDQWFQDICRNVVLETFEQYEANNPRPISGIQKKDIGDGRSEIF